MEITGVIEAVGSKVTRFKVGDEVLASTFDDEFGGYAQYKCLPESSLIAIKPEGLSFGEAAASVGAGLTAIRFIKAAKLQKGQS